eukprot:15365615-Ditylum_brightwellii.AAC.3
MGYEFPIGMYSFRYGCRTADYHTVFKVPDYLELSDEDFIDTIMKAHRSTPTFLCCHETSEKVFLIKKATGIKDQLAKQLYSTILPDGTAPMFDCVRKSETELLKNISDMLLRGIADNEDEEFEVVCDMCKLNICGNTYHSKFILFWESAKRVLEMENGSGTHSFCHAGADMKPSTDISFALMIVSVLQLIKKQKSFWKRKERLKAKMQILLFHQEHGSFSISLHVMKDASQLPATLISYHTASCHRQDQQGITNMRMVIISMLAKKAEESIPNFGFDPSNTVFSVDKSTRVLVSQEGDAPLAADHDWGVEYLIPPVTHKMNNTGIPVDSLFSGGPEGNGKACVSLHDATFVASNCLKHCANLLQLMERRNNNDSDNNPLPLLVHVECDGGSDHHPGFLQNQCALFKMFLLGRMDKLVITHGCLELSYLNTAEHMCPF